ncbi:hypothetical protein SAMD00023353_5100440 [Rosellinia necatrix]|uniref:Uncharacterized protein n=1 Tax=Rosellinia necatrix TaxID=77044 RepID=A0A1W2TR55_ROSNE|nr:hypothetical protein SAMD00023353_5100440 [Rosellinia necatrix]
MRFSTITLGLATAVQGAVIQAREGGCSVALEPTQNPPSKAGEYIAYGSLIRWSKATGGGDATSNWVDYSGSLATPYSFKYKANAIPGYETNAQIKAVLDDGWVGTYLSGETPPRSNDFLITDISCS